MTVVVEGLHKTYDSAGEPVGVFSGLSMTLAAGESLALVGPSGSGKSTLLNILCGLETADSGRLRLFGEELPGPGTDALARLRRARIGVVFQDSNLMPAMTLAENVRLRAHLALGRHQKISPEHWLQRLGLAGLADRYPDQVSGGQRQRAALAMIFAMSPGLVLADEPTGSLDLQTAAQVADELFRWQQEQGCGLILATHDLSLAARCDRHLDLAGNR